MNDRSPQHQIVAVWLDKEIIAAVDKARGSDSRSQFIRNALKEKLERLGYVIDANRFKAPDRAGKGGPKKVRPEMPENLSSRLANSLSSKPGRPDRVLEAERKVLREETEAIRKKK